MKKIDINKIKDEYQISKGRPKKWKQEELQLLHDLTTGDSPVALDFIVGKKIFKNKTIAQLTKARINIRNRAIGWEVKE